MSMTAEQSTVVRCGIGILGGTFDPVHNGHIALAQAALAVFGLRCVEFVPAGSPWQKSLVTPSIHRLRMLLAALRDQPMMRVNDMEIRRCGPTYTIETLTELRETLGWSYPLVLLLGGDQWCNLSTWLQWQNLTDYANIAVCARAGAAVETPQAVAQWAEPKLVPAHELTRFSHGRVAFFDMPSHRASATAVRRTLSRYPYAQAMKMLDGWLPFEVSAYICRHALYGARLR